MLVTLGAILLALCTWLLRLDHFLYDLRYGVFKYLAYCFIGLALLGWAGLHVFRHPSDWGGWFWLFALMGLTVYIVLQWARRHED